MKNLFALVLFTFSVLSADAVTSKWANPISGNWFVNTNWTPNTVPGPGDTAVITNAGTYTVTITNGVVSVRDLQLGAGGNGTQTLLQGSSSVLTITNTGTVGANGLLLVTNQGLAGFVTIQPGGQMQITNSAGKQFYYLNLVNQGTVTWSDGSISVGGSSGQTTTISNGGLWQIIGDNSINNGGGVTPTWINSGTLRKLGGTGTTSFNAVNFVNKSSGLVDVQAGTLNLVGYDTNLFGGTFNLVAPGTIRFSNSYWTDAGGVFTGTGTNLFTSGTLLLRTNMIPGLKFQSGDVYIAESFQAAGTITNLTLDGADLRGTNSVDNGVLTMNGGSVKEKLTILPAGQLVLALNTTKLFYSTAIINQGTVTWNAGSINVGSSGGGPPTTISNGGLWQIVGDVDFSHGGGLTAIWTNSGILRKTSGSSVATLNNFNFNNLPGGLVESLAGTIRFKAGDLSLLGGTFSAGAASTVEIGSGLWLDAGGTTTGAGTNRLNGGTLNLRTNIIPGLQLVAGSVFIATTNTFQLAGVITNLTLDGANLFVTNSVGAGALTVNSGAVSGKLTVQPSGQLLLATAGSKAISFLNLINQGTVLWSGGSLASSGLPGTIISNGGLWQISSDDSISYGGVGAVMVWTNNGTLRKAGGTGVSALTGMYFYNQPGGLVQVDTGTLQLPSIATNTAGTLRLNGGKLSANGNLGFSGGIFEGAGTVGANALSGGLISPGQNNPGLMTFSSGLNLSTNATLALAGIGTLPGTQYDQLSVIGTVVLGSCTLSIVSLPNVPLGTTFVLIDNDSNDAVSGTFNGLPNNSLLTISGQLFRLRYNGGTGNDVTLVREFVTQLTPTNSLLNGAWSFTGGGNPSNIYMIQATTNFIQWTNLGLATGNLSGDFFFKDTNAFRFPYRFYRTTN